MDVFNLQAKIGIDSKDYEKGLSNASSKFSSFADGLKSAAGKLGDILAGIGKAATVGIGAASTAMTSLVKQSLDQVGQYEQMVGGVEKLFGKAAEKVQNYANEAFASAGLSANEYMETVTSFSASLIQSLSGDTMKAADLANTAIKDMSDNANVFGNSMESVQNAYFGIAKQNYQMLDNLKLGYQGNAREMARLINDSGVLGDKLINLDDTKNLNKAIGEVGFAKIIEAIHIIQERMNITGTTAAEASKTLEGSTKAVKAAWQNFLTGVGTPKQFAENLSISIGNIRNNLQTIIPRLTEGLETLFDLIAPEIPPIIEEMLPTIIDASSSLLSGLASRLPQLIKTILPALATGVVDVTTALVQSLPGIITSLKESIPIIVTTIMSKKDDLLKAGGELFDMIIGPLKNPKEIGESAIALVTNLAKKTGDSHVLEIIGGAAGDLIDGLAEGFVTPESIAAFMNAAPVFIKGLVDGVVAFLTGSEKDGEGGLFGAATQIVKSIGDYFADDKNREDFKEDARKVIKALSDGIITVLKGTAPFLVEAAKAWMTVFCGAIDYDAGAKEIVKQLSLAFVRNFGEGFKGLWNTILHPFESLDDFINGGEIATDRAGIRIGDELQEQYLESGSMLGIKDWASVQKVRNQYGNLNYTDAEILDWINSGTTQDFDTYFSDYERRRRYKAEHPDQYVPGFAEGGIVTKPTLAWIGERGEKEAVVPLEHETEIGRSLGLGGGMVIQFGDIYVNGESGDVGQTVIQRLDEALRVWQLQQKRGVGSAAWQV